MTKPIDYGQLIDLLGGTGEVAQLCEVQPPSVSEWRRHGIPKARMKFLRLASPIIVADWEASLLAPVERVTAMQPALDAR